MTFDQIALDPTLVESCCDVVRRGAAAVHVCLCVRVRETYDNIMYPHMEHTLTPCTLTQLSICALHLHVMYHKTTNILLSNQRGIQVATIQAIT